jgi:hypothetical protein
MFVADLSNLCPPTLARGESDGLTKLIFFGIILVVWAVGAIASSIKQAAAKRRANMRPPSMNWQQPAAPAWPSASPPQNLSAARRPQARRIIPPPPIPRQVFAPPPRLPFAMPAETPTPMEPAAATSITPRASTPSPTAGRADSARPWSPSSIGAADIRRWLTPDVLRGQYFVTEVFDPPPGALD